jgi:hypothetical protein
MRSLRPILLAILLVAAFYYGTNRMSGPLGPSWVTRPSHVELTQAAGPGSYDSEEQNNIAVYKKALPSVVNITSTESVCHWKPVRPELNHDARDHQLHPFSQGPARIYR